MSEEPPVDPPAEAPPAEVRTESAAPSRLPVAQSNIRRLTPSLAKRRRPPPLRNPLPRRNPPPLRNPLPLKSPRPRRNPPPLKSPLPLKSPRPQVRPDPKGTFPKRDTDRPRLTPPLPVPIAEPEPEPAPEPEPEPEAAPAPVPDVVAPPAKGAGKPVRQYLDDTVVPVLRKGLRELVKQRPEDPFEFLADFIRSNKPKAS